MNHEACDACTGINGGQNEQGFKQQGKVIPECHHGFARNQLAHDVRHTDCEGRCTAGTGKDGAFTHFFCRVQQGCSIDREVEFGCNHFGSCVGIRTDQGSRAVHGEVHTRIKRRGGGQSHNGHKTFHNHTAIADHADVFFILNHFRCGTGRNQCVEAGNRTTGNGNEQEREQCAGEYGAGTIDKVGYGRHTQIWINNHDAQSQGHNRSDFQEGREIVARSQQQPNRQYRSHETVNHNRPSELDTVKVEPVAK